MTDTSEKTMPGCTVQFVDRIGQPHCQEPVVAAYLTGCVNEHLDEDRYCSRHLGLLHDGALVCVECKSADRRSLVFALAEVLPSGERVRVLKGTAP